MSRKVCEITEEGTSICIQLNPNVECKDCEFKPKITINPPNKTPKQKNPEQDFYDNLKKKSDNELSERAKELEISTWNEEIELNMIRNIMISRNTPLPEFLIAVEPYKFYTEK
jgi:hypothetical protein